MLSRRYSVLEEDFASGVYARVVHGLAYYALYVSTKVGREMRSSLAFADRLMSKLTPNDITTGGMTRAHVA